MTGLTASPAPRPDLLWSTPRQAAALVCRGRTLPSVWRIALVVGTLLTAVNQGTVLTAGHPGAATWARLAANYVIPYTVSSLGLLRAYRTQEER